MPGWCRRVDDVHMNVVVLTNLAREHLEEGERMEDYVSIAASLFARLDDPDTQRAVINVDGAAAAAVICSALGTRALFAMVLLLSDGTRAIVACLFGRVAGFMVMV